MSDQLKEESKSLRRVDMLARFSPRRENVGVKKSRLPQGFIEGIEDQARSYFFETFSGQITVDAMVHILSRFKKSSGKRERCIFECMMQKFFDQYRRFHKYPENKLKIAAALFGSLIKCQLVTGFPLCIAVIGVLDALRQPKESKMFTFGTEALTVFSDRLVEWPLYCKELLQVSHLRGTHPELVAVVESALARNSSRHLELNGTSTAPTESHSSSTLSTSENAEVNMELNGTSTAPTEPHSSSTLSTSENEEAAGEIVKFSEFCNWYLHSDREACFLVFIDP